MKRIVLSLIILTHFVSTKGQNVPTYSWQEHLSFQNAKCIVEVENNIYCATENGLFYYNKDDYTINRLNKINGLSDIGISSLAYDKENKILVIGGGSSEEIDDVRVITNKSTGKMAKHLAETAFGMGAEVQLWMGNSTEEVGEWIAQEKFSSTEDLNKKIKKLGNYDAILVPAALSDFIPTKSKGKISSQKVPEVKLKKAKKSIEMIRKKHKGLLCAFKLGSDIKDSELLEKGKSLLKNADMVIANHSEVLGNEKTKIAIITKKDNTWIEDTKVNASKLILKEIAGKI